jgi:hypothetical protein
MRDLFTAALYGLPAVAFSIGLACWVEQRRSKDQKPSRRVKAVP